MSFSTTGRAPRLAVLLVAAMVCGAVAAMPVTAAPEAGPAAAKGKKKKCGKKKKGKKGAVAAKGCKKVKKKVLPGPLVRGTVTWGQAADVDLHAFDAAGGHAGLVHEGGPPSTMVQGIPNGVHSGDVQTAGSETFTDTAFLANGTGTREFAYVVCIYANGFSGTFTGVTKTGQRTVLPVSGNDGQAIVFTIPGGPAAPAQNPC